MARLLAILENPTQYDPPLFRALASRGNLTPLVWYHKNQGTIDPEIGRKPKWDISMEGYSWEVVPEKDLFTRLMRLSWRPSAILSPGWTKTSTWVLKAFATFWGIPVILPSDKIIEKVEGNRARRAALKTFHTYKAKIFQGFVTTGTLGAECLKSFDIKSEQIATGMYPVDIAFWKERKVALRDDSKKIRDRFPTGSFVVIAVAKMARRENPIVIVQAFAHLKKTLPNACLIFVGDGKLRTEIERIIRENSIESSTYLPGLVAYKELAAYYGAADVFLHVPESEPWGISVLESMACDLPIVLTSSVGAGTDVLIPGATGFWAASSKPEDVALALKDAASIVTDPLTAERVGQAVAPFDVNAAANALEILVRKLQKKR
jgi:glycosyltransferase involved in cell wall biosynthesis